MKIYDVPINTALSFLEATAANPEADMGGISSFAGLSIYTARKAMPVLEELKLVRKGADGGYTCAIDGVRRGLPTEAARQIFRQALLAYRPFDLLTEGINLGEPLPEAARKSCLLLGLEPTDAAGFKVLVKWAKELDILRTSAAGVELAPEMKAPPGEELAIISTSDLESEVKARLYISGKLGRDIFNFLDEVDRKLLIDAALEYRSKPRDSVEHSGQALEDFLRDLAKLKGHEGEAKKCNGMGQLASLLASKGLVHTHHQHFIDGVGAARNATTHRKDKKTLVPWQFTDLGAFWALSGALAVIRSIYLYVHEGKQSL
jgi:hypothetical protein